MAADIAKDILNDYPLEDRVWDAINRDDGRPFSRARAAIVRKACSGDVLLESQVSRIVRAQCCRDASIARRVL